MDSGKTPAKLALGGFTESGGTWLLIPRHHLLDPGRLFLDVLFALLLDRERGYELARIRRRPVARRQHAATASAPTASVS